MYPLTTRFKKTIVEPSNGICGEMYLTGCVLGLLFQKMFESIRPFIGSIMAPKKVSLENLERENFLMTRSDTL